MYGSIYVFLLLLRFGGKELKMIRKKLGESGRQIRFRAEVAKPANLRGLLNSGCRVFHYVGPGCGDFLALESNQARLCGVMEPLHVRLNIIRVALYSCMYEGSEDELAACVSFFSVVLFLVRQALKSMGAGGWRRRRFLSYKSAFSFAEGFLQRE